MELPSGGVILLLRLLLCLFFLLKPYRHRKGLFVEDLVVVVVVDGYLCSLMTFVVVFFPT